MRPRRILLLAIILLVLLLYACQKPASAAPGECTGWPGKSVCYEVVAGDSSLVATTYYHVPAATAWARVCASGARIGAELRLLLVWSDRGRTETLELSPEPWVWGPTALENCRVWQAVVSRPAGYELDVRLIRRSWWPLVPE